MNKTTKWALIISLATFLFICGYRLYSINSSSRVFDSNYSEQDLANNYNLKAKEINGLRVYINSIIPTGKSVRIEFDNEGALPIFHVEEDNIWDSNWDLKLDATKTNALLKKLGWTKETLLALKDKLNQANCISIASGNPCQIGFQRSGMGLYFYDLFDEPIADSLKSNYNDSCTYIFHNSRTVFEYDGGAAGPRCFPEFIHRR